MELEAAHGFSHEVHVLLPDQKVYLKTIDSCDANGVDFTVEQSKKILLDDIDVQRFFTNADEFKLVLKKGKDSIEMEDDRKTLDYLYNITDHYILEIKLI